MPFAGIIPVGRYLLIVGAKALPFNGSIYLLYDDQGEPMTLFIVISLLLSLFTVGASIWSAIGDNEGRIAFLAFVSLNVCWWTFIVVLSLSGLERGDPATIGLVLSLIFPFVWLGSIWLYFTRPNVVKYYKRDQMIDQVN